VERLSCRFADHVIVANDLWRAKLVQRAVAAEKCTTLLNYPDLRLFRPLAEKEKRPAGKFIILYPGTLNYHQGVDIAIKAFALVKDRMPNAEFHIYGEGPARPELVRLTRECGLNGRVRLMAPVPVDKIAGVMASADLGVEPKRAEGFGNQALSMKILEFMACGLPSVVSRTEVHAHYFDDTLVRFFAPGNETNLAEALVEAYGHPADLDWARRAQDFAFRNSWQKRVVEYERLIDSLVAKFALP
jgi:glycosyltransferase involved in cell wall biosynthesis